MYYMLESNDYEGHGSQSKKGEWPKICKLGSHDLTSEGSVVVKNYPNFMKNTWIWINFLRSFRWNCQISAIVRNQITDFWLAEIYSN